VERVLSVPNEEREMKTPMQELISVIRKRQEDEDVQPFMWLEQIVELAESMLEKEKEVMESAWQDGMYECDGDGTFEDFYKTFNTKEK
jgi:hypothetical protein